MQTVRAAISPRLTIGLRNTMTANIIFEKGYKEGASSSIKKTLSDIELILEGEELINSGEMRTELRDKILVSLTELSTRWYKKGFNRGHKECFSHLEKHEEFPMTIRKTLKREFLPNNQAVVKLKSTLKPEYTQKVEDSIYKKANS